MAEYYAVLKRAVASLDSNAVDARRAVYDKARNALIGQLKAVDPPLTTAEISRQRLELEEAIRKVEREAAERAPDEPRAAAAAGVAGAAALCPGDRRRPLGRPGAVGPGRIPPGDRGRPEPRLRGWRCGRIARRRSAPSSGNPTGGNMAIRRRPTNAPRATGCRRLRCPPSPSTTTCRRGGPTTATARRTKVRSRDLLPNTPRSGSSRSHRSRPPQQRALTIDRRDRPVYTPPASSRAYLEADDQEIVEREPRRRRLPGVLLFVLIVAVIGGLGALAWSQRAVLTDLVASFDGGGAAPTPAPPAAGDDAGTGKNPDRLLEGEAPPAKEVRSVDPAATASDESAGEPLPEGADAETAAPDAAADSETAAATAAPGDTAGDGLAQKAVLYEEPLNASGDAERQSPPSTPPSPGASSRTVPTVRRWRPTSPFRNGTCRSASLSTRTPTRRCRRAT